MQHLQEQAPDVDWIFDEESWQKSQRMLKNTQEIADTRHAINLTERIWERIEHMVHAGEIC